MTAPAGPELLIIDDEAGIVDMLAIVFKGAGYRVATARSCTEGLARLEGSLPDLVLTDVKMPDGSGFEILKKSRELAPTVPVVMITAYTTTKTAIEALKAGAYDYISKPFDVEEMKHVVERALERKRLAEENVALKAEIAERHRPHAQDERERLQGLRQIHAPPQAVVAVVRRGVEGVFAGGPVEPAAVHDHTTNASAMPAEPLVSEWITLSAPCASGCSYQPTIDLAWASTVSTTQRAYSSGSMRWRACSRWSRDGAAASHSCRSRP